jgi:uncharacterized protein YfiM (DUF2279 family)
MIPGLSLVFTLQFGPAGAARAPGDESWRSSDKAKHFVMSAFVDCLTFSVLRTTRVSREGALVTAGVVAAGVGLGKEVYDRKFGGDPSFKDLAADGAGVAAATALLGQTSR